MVIPDNPAEDEIMERQETAAQEEMQPEPEPEPEPPRPEHPRAEAMRLISENDAQLALASYEVFYNMYLEKFPLTSTVSNNRQLAHDFAVACAAEEMGIERRWMNEAKE